jgi:MFS transporter, MHS family, shikimate and dehydroshikimate transport protein
MSEMTEPAKPTPPANPTELRRVVFGALVGTALEWYDFFIYGTAAALLFGDLFFPESDSATGTIAAFATFGVGFLFRPLGGIIFGHLGDRIGRRSTLIITTLIMGIATGMIGLLPTYESVGLWAPVLLTLLRICQGLGAGAEFGGASTLLAEHAATTARSRRPECRSGSSWAPGRSCWSPSCPRRPFSPGAGGSRSWSASR